MSPVLLRVVMYRIGRTQSVIDRSEVPLNLSLGTTPRELINALRHLFPHDYKPRVVLLIVDGKRVHRSRADAPGFGYATTSVVLRELASGEQPEQHNYVMLD